MAPPRARKGRISWLGRTGGEPQQCGMQLPRPPPLLPPTPTPGLPLGTDAPAKLPSHLGRAGSSSFRVGAEPAPRAVRGRGRRCSLCCPPGSASGNPSRLLRDGPYPERNARAAMDLRTVAPTVASQAATEDEGPPFPTAMRPASAFPYTRAQCQASRPAGCGPLFCATGKVPAQRRGERQRGGRRNGADGTWLGEGCDRGARICGPTRIGKRRCAVPRAPAEGYCRPARPLAPRRYCRPARPLAPRRPPMR
jgi:hypothetical protein